MRGGVKKIINPQMHVQNFACSLNGKLQRFDKIKF